MSRRETKFYLKAIIIILFLLAILGYAGFEIWDYVMGPKIIVSSPSNGSTVSQSLILVAGQTKNIKEISLNDRSIMIDPEGNFKEEFLLSYGFNVLKLEARDKFGKNTEQILQIVYK